MEQKPDKPMLFANNPFNDIPDDGVSDDWRQWDRSYVPKYSEQRIEYEKQVAKGKNPSPMPKLYWARVSKTDGSSVGQTDEGMIDVMQLGYRAIGTAELESRGWGFPPSAHVGPDGLIRRDDVALFIVGEDRAERNRVEQTAVNAAASSNRGPLNDTGALYEVQEDHEDHRGSLKDMLDVELPQLK